MSGSDRFWFLFAAYAVVWGLLAFFLAYLGRRTREIERDLRTLEERMSSSARR